MKKDINDNDDIEILDDVIEPKKEPETKDTKDNEEIIDLDSNSSKNSNTNSNDQDKKENINTNDEEYEETNIKYDETKITKTTKRKDSYFDGSLLELIGWKILAFLITTVTLTIASPWAKCMLLRYRIGHTVCSGKRLKFEGTGGSLFVERFKWFFFTIITCGIYALFIPIKKTKWIISNIHFEEEPLIKDESFFNGSTLGLIGINVLCFILNTISLGILSSFTYCYKLKWITKHSIINRKKIVFTGSAINYFLHQILWFFLTIITFGIFGLWLGIVKTKWEVKHTHIKLAHEKPIKDNSWLIGIVITILIIALGITLIPKIVSSLTTAPTTEEIEKIKNIIEVNLKEELISKKDELKTEGTLKGFDSLKEIFVYNTKYYKENITYYDDNLSNTKINFSFNYKNTKFSGTLDTNTNNIYFDYKVYDLTHFKYSLGLMGYKDKIQYINTDHDPYLPVK